MNLDEICQSLSAAGKPNALCESFEVISAEEIHIRAKSDPFSNVIKKALEVNFDSKIPLYLHQYDALRALAEGKDVLLISPCGSGKTRVLKNAPMVAKLGFEFRSSIGESDLPNPKTPLGIVCCPLSAIMEDKIRDQENSGMLSMYGGYKTGRKDLEAASSSEENFLSEKLTLIYGHPESYTTEIGKNVLESNEERICLYATDEVGFNIWGPDFRILMSSVPGSIRAFSPSAPLICMSATIGKIEQKKIMEDLGMTNRLLKIIDYNPVPNHILISKLKRPSNQKPFYDEGGLKDVLCDLYLSEFISDPENSRKAVIFCKSEEDLVSVYEFIEERIGDKFKNMKTRSWVQYHSSLGNNTLKWIHQRMEAADGKEVRLFIATYKLVMGVDIKDLDLAIFIR